MNGIPDLKTIFSDSTERVVRVRDTDVTARVIPIDFDDGQVIVTTHLLETVRNGGNLAIIERSAEWEPISNPAAGTSVGFRYTPGSQPEYFLYHFIDCSFPYSVKLIPVLCEGDGISDTKESIIAVTHFLEEMYLRQEIAIFEYLSTGIAVRQIGFPKSDWRDEVKRVLAFAEQELGATYSREERAAYLEQFTKFGFFALSFG
jgi:hypothetical protein